MKDVLIIPGSYKSTISSCMAGDIIRQEYLLHRPCDSVCQVSIADGGEGTLEVFSRNFGGFVRYYKVRGMVGESIVAESLWLDTTTVVIESSTVVGYSLVNQDARNPWKLSSYGIGELLLCVKADGAKKIYVTMGDSSIMDIGVGMLCALGVKFLDGTKRILEMSDLSFLSKIQSIDCDKMASFSDVDVFALVDTKDFLFGQYGQTKVYGKQKGLEDSQASLVEDGFQNYAKVVKNLLGIDLAPLPMTTGSGGLAASMYAFCGAQLIHCPEFISNKINLSRIAMDANILITGEGLLDNQTRWGKIPHFVSNGFRGDVFLIVGNYTEEGLNDIKEVCHGNVYPFLLDKSAPPFVGIANATKRICSFITAHAEDDMNG